MTEPLLPRAEMMGPAAAERHANPGRYRDAQAVISEDGKYRYTLIRDWHPDRPTVVFCMLNPSTADGTVDDPTIRRCVGLADSWEYGRLVVVNLFAYRATDPRELAAVDDPVGPENDRWLDWFSGGDVVCAWGAGIERLPHGDDRVYYVRHILRSSQQHHLGLTKHGHPRHPLYVPGGTKLQWWSMI